MLTTDGEVKGFWILVPCNIWYSEAQTQALAFGSQAYMAPVERMLQEEYLYGDVFSLVTF